MYSSKLQIRLGNRYGFTLIELMFVIVILGVLASIVLGQFRDMTGDAGKSAFMTSGRIFTQAAMRFHLDNGEYPENAGSGVLPAGFGSYVQANRWEGGTPIGGVWDSENNSFGIVSAVGVHFDGTGDTRDDAFMQEIDANLDDGDLGTGGFRKIDADRYYFIVAD
ncbi:MAG: type II secretion system protein [Planctomycetota bacterium]|jgi:prepilin-type N-terminal cleavage/methylation domain-containing protein